MRQMRKWGKIISRLLVLALFFSMFTPLEVSASEDNVQMPAGENLVVEASEETESRNAEDYVSDNDLSVTEPKADAVDSEEQLAPEESPTRLEAATYEIKTAADFANIANDLTGNYILTKNISLSGYTSWTPLGTFAEPFSGTLDGGGYKISGLSVNTGVVVTGTVTGMGLFGRNDGTIKNLKVDGTLAGGTSSYCGLVAAYNAGTLQEISVTGTVAGGSYSGLLAGYSTSTIENCQADGTVTCSKGDDIGGLTGYNSGSIKNCRMTGSVKANGDSSTGYRIGGLTGYNGAKGIIQSCEVNSTVSGRAVVGGVVGSNSGTVENSENESSQVSGTGNTYTQINGIYLYRSLTGGFAGWNGGAIRSCGTESAVRGTYSCVGGFVGANQGTIEDGRAACSVEQTDVNYGRCGGFAGSNHATLARCLAEGTVSGAGTDNGGFVGYSEGVIQYCAAIGG